MLYVMIWLLIWNALLLATAGIGTLTLFAIYRMTGGKMGIRRYFKEML